jgi:hypothetical protein
LAVTRTVFVPVMNRQQDLQYWLFIVGLCPNEFVRRSKNFPDGSQAVTVTATEL